MRDGGRGIEGGWYSGDRGRRRDRLPGRIRPERQRGFRHQSRHQDQAGAGRCSAGQEDGRCGSPACGAGLRLAGDRGHDRRPLRNSAESMSHKSVAVRTRGLVLTEHEFPIPLDHSRPNGERISVFAREVSDPDGLDRPFLVFFQGGPGHEASRPTRNPSGPGWLDRALKEFRVLMLDQRGTGRSSPVGTLPGLTPRQQADYLTHFRADAIVRDAEWIRRELGIERWSVLGQSFGGFCVTAYLSCAPRSLREAFITGAHPSGVHQTRSTAPLTCGCWIATASTTNAIRAIATWWSPCMKGWRRKTYAFPPARSEEHTSELQSQS